MYHNQKKVTMLRRLALFIFCFYVPMAAEARQINWQADESGYYANYAISWQDFNGQTQSLRFKVEADHVEQAQSDSQTLHAQEAVKVAYAKAVKEAKRSARRGVNIQVIPRAGNLSFRASGPDERVVDREIERVKRLADKEMQDYLRDQNYKMDGGVIETDYAKISRNNYFAMRPLARAIQDQTRGQDIRGVVNYTLSFLQTIPYKTYTPRSGDRFSALFNTPLRLIANNKGDCDDKSLAFGTLLKIMYPSLDVALVLVPGHAFVAMDIPTQAGDMTMTEGGRTYVLAEPVGPAAYPVGQIAQSSVDLARQGYSFRHVPDRY